MKELAPLLYFIVAITAWLLIQLNIDADNPCSAFNPTGICGSGIEP
jgi:hypothetical protein